MPLLLGDFESKPWAFILYLYNKEQIEKSKTLKQNINELEKGNQPVIYIGSITSGQGGNSGISGGDGGRIIIGSNITLRETKKTNQLKRKREEFESEESEEVTEQFIREEIVNTTQLPLPFRE